MQTLVTGGGGFLGLYLVEQLVARGDTVRVLCRGKYPRLDELGVQYVQGDIRDEALVVEACRGVETVYHAAAVSGIWGPWQHYYGINTLGTRNVIGGCKAHGVARLVHTSSPSVVYDGQPHHLADESLPYPDKYLCHYPHSKALAERDVLAANSPKLATVALRPHLIWGPRDNHLIPRLLARARAGRLRRVGNGENVISMAYVENVAAAHLQAAERLTPGSPVAGQAYFINEREPVVMWRWIDEILALAGLPPIRTAVSANAGYAIGAVLESVYHVLRVPGEPPMTRFLASQLSTDHCYRVDKAERDFGYHAVVSVEEGMRRLQNSL